MALPSNVILNIPIVASVVAEAPLTTEHNQFDIGRRFTLQAAAFLSWKTVTWIIYFVFAKRQMIFKIFSLTDSAKNVQ